MKNTVLQRARDRRHTPGQGWTPGSSPLTGTRTAHLHTGLRKPLGQARVGFACAPAGVSRKLCRDVLADWPAGGRRPFHVKEPRPRKAVTLAASQAATLPSTKARVCLSRSVPQLGQQGAAVAPYRSLPAPPCPLLEDDSLPLARCPAHDVRGPRLEGDRCSREALGVNWRHSSCSVDPLLPSF